MKYNFALLIFAFVLMFSVSAFAQSYNDAALARVTSQDRSSRNDKGEIPLLSMQEHIYRGDVYMANRHFPEARIHWQKIIENFSDNEPAMAKALFGTARSYMWEREYQKAVDWFDKLTKNYLNTKDGREGLAFKGASYVRLGKNLEAAKTYEQYTVMFPSGERIESSYLNIIDAYREAKKYDEANAWVEKAQAKFGNSKKTTNALQSRVRMEIFRQNWNGAVAAADETLRLNRFVGSMTSDDEIKYLKAFALEKAGRKADAISVYNSIPDSFTSYYGGLAKERLDVIQPNNFKKTASVNSAMTREYPVMYRAELLRFGKMRKVDPRFMLAIMKQESSFRANAKSPSAARGLLQLVFDTALKYNKKAGYPNLQPDDLYNPTVNIALGSLYMAELKDQFDGVYEAIAASYNGGEDNAARWLNRSNPKEPAIFASEVGFAETKHYVFKVMNNYRVYRELYTEDLQRK
jgi:soluble lytic murein transglycosylase-like protein/outer membrane protein assembly factor BamD (BamD/ComL family)